ncbi:hypothetical protein WMY93_020619 [Mugilogobius chulae]|uniref:Integrase zinc-binding domain-containing protein n=1 Tax=Mugilogobius chulae TaxID=88201 RepID=A0AAW0NIF4_9GOBI
MSLRSGKNYLKEYEQQDEAEVQAESDVSPHDDATPDQSKPADQPSPDKQQPSPPRSKRSRAPSRRSHSSSSSSVFSATKAYAKAQAAKAQLIFAEKEANMMRQKAELEANTLKQKADLDASLHILQCEKEVAAAEAEAAAYEEVQSQSGESDIGPSVQDEPFDTVQRTSDYVEQQSKLLGHSEIRDNTLNLFVTDQPLDQVKTAAQHVQSPVKSDIKYEPSAKIGPSNSYSFNPLAHTFQPTNKSKVEPDGAQGFANYLIRKELVSTGLLQFDDKPENYWAWKASFVSATKDLNLSAREELDLLTKWLGPKSSEQAKRIRAVHSLNPAAGVKMMWERLEESYGSSEAIEDALLKKIEEFPKLTNKDGDRLRELGDILLELNCAKSDGTLPGLAYLDTARGVRQVVEKLPYNLQERWTNVGTQYKETHRVSFPPFSVFVQFIQHQAKMKNDPSFALSSCNTQASARTEKSTLHNRRATVSVHRTDVAEKNQSGLDKKKIEEPDRQCPIHKKPHPLKKCKSFRDKPIEERQAFLKEHRICFRCCGSVQHIAKDCKVAVKCVECDSPKHISALHPGPTPVPKNDTSQSPATEEQTENPPAVVSKCTEKDRALNMYAVIDEQSNRSLAKTEFFNLFEIKTTPAPYTLKTCSGKAETTGRRAVDFIIESMDGKTNIKLPPLIECDSVPDDRSEIPSPEIAQHHPHLLPIANKIQPVDHHAPILLLLGRDILSVHKVREQINGPSNAPYAQRLDLGWVVVGEVCLGRAHNTNEVNVYKTHMLDSGRTTHFEPCPNIFSVKEQYSVKSQPNMLTATNSVDTIEKSDQLGQSVFDRTESDDKLALSIDDKTFLTIMDNAVTQNKESSWVAPLPFRSPRRRLPSNRDQALKRLYSLKKTLEKKPEMKDHYIQFMQKMLDNDQAELAPPLLEGKEHWYLPTFGVYHPQKPDQIRVVFDSSAECEGTSLNQVLLSGPDLNNSLLGVLLRFRKEPIALTADVQQMFYCFEVCEEHRDYLRYLWFEDNDITKNVIEYRMKVHVFGNSPSPAVAIYCMRRAAKEGEQEHGTDARQFVERQFYVDDGLTSVATPEQAVDLLTRTKNMLAESNLRLHKVASNCSLVMEVFPVEDRAKDLKDLDLGIDPLPVQRSLGLCWNLQTDSFTYLVSDDTKPFTRRGVLSTVNSLYDPLGFAAPIIMQGKALLRELSSEERDWDAPLPPEKEEVWTSWKDSLKALEDLQIKRCYCPGSLSAMISNELCIFSDASTVAIGAVAYLRSLDSQGQYHVGFVMGKSKLAPRPAHTVPRLELCAAVLAVEMYELIRDELDIQIDNVKFFTDSRIVLGYIHNSTKRFYMYVANRVTRIRLSTHPDQWRYVPTELNPADQATRFIPAAELKNSNWFTGPRLLYSENLNDSQKELSFSLVEPEQDKEIRPQVKTLATAVSQSQLSSERFQRYSSWTKACRAVAKLIHVLASFKQNTSGQRGWKSLKESTNVKELTQAKNVIIRSVQQDAYKETFKKIKEGKKINSKNDTLRKLNPVMDKDGLLRVGGRLSSADLTENEKHPLIIPSSNHIATLLVRHFHEQSAHQGRHITEGAVRGAGFWIVGGKRLVSSVIHNCVTCRKLRGSGPHHFLTSKPHLCHTSNNTS